MIDGNWMGHMAWNWDFFTAVLSIVLIDLVLAGDNAVVIAMAVRNLKGKTRRLGIVLGAGGAVVIRIFCTFLVARLLSLPFIKLLGGAAIIWIAIKLLTDVAGEEHEERECGGLWQALWVIVVADLSMGIDNMLAVGAASQENPLLLVFGLLLSIPMVVFMSSWLALLMDRYPAILWLGAIILGKVGGAMMISDPWVHETFAPPAWADYGAMGFFIAFVCLVSWYVIQQRKRVAAGTAS